ncbi:tetratricopeptide repeat protein [Synechococcus sp. CBW1004]|uniref:tetratricopeptide repeat protein n=1 Tax=Synechococcus sp. CBW1004 TaxID=1353136 RepID=UPI0018CEFA78|nr:tetratricopeptide repeat protein [Synechococcus sp. CBW1004]QPN62156.1 EAL domain-containing protein [Synechococcus sp. CBW1004]
MEFTTDIMALEPTLEENLLMGQALLQSRQLEAAVEEFQAALAKAPELAHIHLALGKIYSRKHDYEKAEEAFTNAARVDPLSAQPLLALARLHLHRGELDKAVEGFKAALAIDTRSDAAMVGLGKIALQCDQLQEAEMQLQKALEMVPELIEAKLPLAEVYRKARRWDDAIRLLEHVPAGSPQAPVVKPKQADLLLSCHRYDEARVVLERLRADYPLIIGTTGPAQLDMMTAFLATGNVEAAREAESTTTDFRRLAARQQRLKGVIQIREGDDQAAMDCFLGSWEIDEQIRADDQQQRRWEGSEGGGFLLENLARLQFSLDARPVVDLQDGRIVGWEARVNWQDQLKTMIQDQEFAKEMEGRRLSRPLGWWLMGAACRHLGSTLGSDGFVCIELTKQQLLDQTLCEQMSLAAGAFQLPVSVIIPGISNDVIDWSDTAWLENRAGMERLMIRLAVTAESAGSEQCRLVDQGNARLLRFSCSSILNDASMAGMLQQMHSEEVETLAFGIETDEAVNRLREMGVKYGIGPMYSIKQP